MTGNSLAPIRYAARSHRVLWAGGFPWVFGQIIRMADPGRPKLRVPHGETVHGEPERLTHYIQHIRIEGAIPALQPKRRGPRHQ